MFVFGNVFAFFAMATSFLLTGVALKDSLAWDYRMKPHLATVVTLAVPFLIFALGLRSFITAIDIVGGVFVSIEVLLILLMYVVAKKRGDLPVKTYVLKHVPIFGALLAVIFTIGTVYSVWQLFV
jgi:amino acid permease